MARLVIEGDAKRLKVIAKENRLRASKYGLKITLTEPKEKQAESKPPVKKEPKQKKLG